jgi:hypothetical protein
VTVRRALLSVLLGLLLGGGPTPAGAAPEEADALDEALAGVGLHRADLGWEAEGWWSGYPVPTHALRHVEGLFRSPLATVPYLRGFGAIVEDALDPERSGERGSRGAGWLLRAVHGLGINPRYGGFRAYSANLLAGPTPLDQAVLAAYRHAARPTTYVTFGEPSPYPRLEADLAAAVAPIPEAVSGLLGRLVLDLVEARAWAERAWRDVPLELRARVAARLDLGVESVDALDYEPAFDDVARRWDEASLWYAAMKTVEALDRARADLLPLVRADEEALRALRFVHDTPLGAIRIDGTGESIEVAEGPVWLAVDLGGETVWRGPFAASGPEAPLSALLDLGGDDRYEAAEARTRSQGSGVVGVAILLDAAGNDRYVAPAPLSQGAGQFGLGALIDLAGDDRYEAGSSAQGCGYFGIGLLLDIVGADRYDLHAEGQGFGGVAGVGVLADRRGDDRYRAEPDAAKTGRRSYHSEERISVSNAQGCAMGRRGDGADGHSWGGGLGLLLDAGGDDVYEAGNWAQGTGYWFGTGLLWDGGGNDAYRANGWAQASGAHFCVGALVDEDGDDTYRVAQNWGPAFGHDFTVALLADLGGDDAYYAGGGGLAASINRSVVLLLDAAGRDAYAFGGEGDPGTATFDARFLDLGGEDVYPGTRARNDAAWGDPPDAPNLRARNFGVGVDRAGGRLDLERPSPRRGRDR